MDDSEELYMDDSEEQGATNKWDQISEHKFVKLHKGSWQWEWGAIAYMIWNQWA